MENKELLKHKLSERIKEAGVSSWLKGMWKGTGSKALKTGLGFGAAGLILGAGAAAASGGIQVLKDPIKRRLGENRMYRENPWLRDEDTKTVGQYYKTLYRFAPTMAMDPLVAGSFMKKQLEYKDVGIQPSDVNTLANIQKAVIDRRDKSRNILGTAFAPDTAKSYSSTIDRDE